MSDDENRMIRRVRRVVDTGRRRGGQLIRPASWVGQKADQLVVKRIGDRVDRLLLALTEPENARRLQDGLAHVAQLAMELGFHADPHAEQLYELVTWLEEEHGRPQVLARVASHVASTQATLLRALDSILDEAGPTGGPMASAQAARRMHEMREVAASELLNLLCTLAAIECGVEPPEDTLEARVGFYEQAELPEQFRDLAAKAAGIPGAFEATREPEKQSLLSRIRGRKPADPATSGHSGERGLARFVPSFDDPHLRFLTLSHLFFLQSYLTRNLIEALPELLDLARPDAITDSSS